MCDIFDCDRPSAYREVWRRARKEHRCEACYEPIRPGERYNYVSGVWDGEASAFKRCARCAFTFKRLVDLAPVGDVVALDLDCGEVYEGDDQELLALAFMTPTEAQERLERSTP